MPMHHYSGTLVSVRYQEQGFKLGLHNDTMVVEYQGPDGSLYTHQLGNPGWHLSNPSLQFMAYCGYQPSDFDGTSLTAVQDGVTVPVTHNGDGWSLHTRVLEQGRLALEDADWFEPVMSGHDDRGGNGPGGGGGPDPGTGNTQEADV